jgi:hypothetical protein
MHISSPYLSPNYLSLLRLLRLRQTKNAPLGGAFFHFCVSLYKCKASANHCRFSYGTPYAYLPVIGLNLFEGAFYGNRKHDAN